MTADEQRQLIERLVDLAHDYREGEIATLDRAHFERWVEQFSPDDRAPILEELEVLLAYQYLRKTDAETFLDGLLSSGQLLGDDPERALDTACFIKLRNTTRSQDHWLRLVDSLCIRKYSRGIRTEIRLSDTFVYGDDAIFTGGTFDRALRGSEFVEVVEPAVKRGARLSIVHFAVHTRGRRKNVESRLRNYGANTHEWMVHRYANELWQSDAYDCYWPHEITGVADVDEYAARLRRSQPQSPPFRPPGVPVRDYVFGTEEGRVTIERAFLLAGLKLGRARNWPPMGYDTYKTFGFGSVFFTHRNISNTCPLALWSTSEGWHPLFPRKWSLTGRA